MLNRAVSLAKKGVSLIKDFNYKNSLDKILEIVYE